MLPFATQKTRRSDGVVVLISRRRMPSLRPATFFDSRARSSVSRGWAASCHLDASCPCRARFRALEHPPQCVIPTVFGGALGVKNLRARVNATPRRRRRNLHRRVRLFGFAVQDLRVISCLSSFIPGHCLFVVCPSQDVVGRSCVAIISAQRTSRPF